MPRSEALWYVAEGRVACRAVDVPLPGDGQVLVRARFSGVSRGTERLVLKGCVPASEHGRMRCPHQEGDFPFPVKYGYALVGAIESGPRAGENVFVLHPHQQLACVPLAEAISLPPELPPRRAALAANMETALNVIWDADVVPGSRVLVIGGGVLGLLIASLAAAVPGTHVTVADIDPSRAGVAGKLGAAFSAPSAAPEDQDIVIHTSASEDGLRRALACAGYEATVVEASWHGDRLVSLPLGEAFHSRRLKLISSQVGAVPAARRARWTTGRRLQAALALLCNDAFDALITGELAFSDVPDHLPRVLTEGSSGLMTVLRYS